MKKELVYLACPYNHISPKIRELRFELANIATVKLIREGYLVYSPISHSHPICIAGMLSPDYAVWSELDERMLASCDKLVVLKLEGWTHSIGVGAELAMAKSLCKPIMFAEP